MKDRRFKIGLMFWCYALTMIDVVLAGLCYATNNWFAAAFVSLCGAGTYICAKSIRKELGL